MSMFRLAIPALIIGLFAPACTVDTRSDQYRCAGPGDCTGSRECVDGWCVIKPDPVQPDAAPISTDAPPAGCPGACTRCDPDGTCVIDCNQSGACQDSIMCPGGRPCEIICSGDVACAGNIDCHDSTSCNLLCSGVNACNGTILCSAGACQIECSGAGSCTGAIDCSDSCACDTSCLGTNSCASGSTCPRDNQCASGNGCSSSASGVCSRC